LSNFFRSPSRTVNSQWQSYNFSSDGKVVGNWRSSRIGIYQWKEGFRFLYLCLQFSNVHKTIDIRFGQGNIEGISNITLANLGRMGIQKNHLPENERTTALVEDSKGRSRNCLDKLLELWLKNFVFSYGKEGDKVEARLRMWLY